MEIIARDGFKKTRGVGGDYFRVKAITTNANFSAGTSSDGEVIDHGDGTYSAYITLKVSKQVHSEEKMKEQGPRYIKKKITRKFAHHAPYLRFQV